MSGLRIPVRNHFVMIIPAKVVDDGLINPMSIYYYDTYRRFYQRGLIKYRKRKGFQVPEEYKNKDIGIIR